MPRRVRTGRLTLGFFIFFGTRCGCCSRRVPCKFVRGYKIRHFYVVPCTRYPEGKNDSTMYLTICGISPSTSHLAGKGSRHRGVGEGACIGFLGPTVSGCCGNYYGCSTMSYGSTLACHGGQKWVPRMFLGVGTCVVRPYASCYAKGNSCYRVRGVVLARFNFTGLARPMDRDGGRSCTSWGPMPRGVWTGGNGYGTICIGTGPWVKGEGCVTRFSTSVKCAVSGARCFSSGYIFGLFMECSLSVSFATF